MPVSKINIIIPKGAHELIRDRIAEILTIEIGKQFILSYDKDFDLSVFIERNTPIDKTELSVVNVFVLEGNYSNKNQGSVDGAFQIIVDIETNSETIGDKGGDYLSSLKCQKILRVCRYVLEDPEYKTLGFAPPFISRVYVSNFKIGQKQNMNDGLNSMLGRITFNVVANEKNSLIDPPLITGYETQLKIAESDKGYFYKVGN